MNLEKSWLLGVCDSHDEQSDEDKQVEEEGSSRVCLDQVTYLASSDHDGC